MKEYTKARFTADLKASIERNRRIDVRTVANNTRTSIAEVQSWLDGKTMPEPNVFGRMCATLYDLTHWRPHYRQVYQADLLQQKKAELAPDGQVLVAFRRPRKPEPEPEPEAAEAVAADEARPVGAESWWAKLQRLRTAAGLSLDDLAALTGVTKSAVQFWEAGRATPTGERRQAILELWPELAGDLPPDEPGDRAKPGRRARGTRQRKRGARRRARAGASADGSAARPAASAGHAGEAVARHEDGRHRIRDGLGEAPGEGRAGGRAGGPWRGPGARGERRDDHRRRGQPGGRVQVTTCREW